MKVLAQIILSITLFALSTCCFAQDKVLAQNPGNMLYEIIDADYPAIKIEAFLDSLHYLYDYDFSYDPSQIPTDSIVNAVYHQQSLYYILKDVLSPYNFLISSIGRQVIIAQHKGKAALSNYITINGTIVSADNSQPLPLVNIAIKGQPLGTTSNTEGEFSFLIPREHIHGKLNLSSIGYQSDSLLIPKTDTTLLIILSPQTIRLKEIKVVFLPAGEIVKKLIKNRERNYFTDPMLLTAFFRETIKQDGKYIEVSEAVIEIFKGSYLNTDDKENARFIKGRKRVEDKEVSVARLKLAGGPALFATIDVAKHLDFISGRDGQNYSYTYQGKEIVHNRVSYKLGFKPITELDGIYYEGDLYVDVESFALIRAEFGMTKKTLRNSNKYFILKNAKKVKSTPAFTSYSIDYRPYNDKWLLNSVRGELIIKMQDKRNKIKSEYQISSEMLITDAQPGEGQSIRYSEAFKTNYVLADKIVAYEPSFWKDYNVIRPEDELEKVFKNAAVEINLVPQTKKTKH